MTIHHPLKCFRRNPNGNTVPADCCFAHDPLPSVWMQMRGWRWLTSDAIQPNSDDAVRVRVNCLSGAGRKQCRKMSISRKSELIDGRHCLAVRA